MNRYKRKSHETCRKCPCQQTIKWRETSFESVIALQESLLETARWSGDQTLQKTLSTSNADLLSMLFYHKYLERDDLAKKCRQINEEIWCHCYYKTLTCLHFVNPLIHTWSVLGSDSKIYLTKTICVLLVFSYAPLWIYVTKHPQSFHPAASQPCFDILILKLS